MRIALVIPVFLLVGCFSVRWDISDDAHYRSLVGHVLHTTVELHLYRARDRDYEFTPYKLSRMRVNGVTPERQPLGHPVATFAPGRELRVTSFKRQRGGDGHVWDYMLGEIALPDEGRVVTFEYLIGLTGRVAALPLVKR